jgi:hypothetical protein
MVFTFASNLARTMQLATMLGDVDEVGAGHRMPHYSQAPEGLPFKLSAK